LILAFKPPQIRRSHKGSGINGQAATVIALMCTSIAPAIAHSHVRIEIKSALVFSQEGLIQGLSRSWVFDDAYAQAALDGIDTNKDGTYSADEIAPLTLENLNSLKEYRARNVPDRVDTLANKSNRRHHHWNKSRACRWSLKC
jgi:hypothetical protein